MNNPRLTFAICLFLAVLFISTAASSSYTVTYYTWVDKNGVTHVTENKEEIPKNRINTVKTFESNSKFDTVAKYYLYIKSNYHLFGKYLLYTILAIILFIILRRDEFLKFGVQSTGQKSYHVIADLQPSQSFSVIFQFLPAFHQLFNHRKVDSRVRHCGSQPLPGIVA